MRKRISPFFLSARTSHQPTLRRLARGRDWPKFRKAPSFSAINLSTPFLKAPAPTAVTAVEQAHVAADGGEEIQKVGAPGDAGPFPFVFG